MKTNFAYNNKKELRKGFFQYCQELNISTKGKKTKFDITLNIAFQEWKDFLKDSGQISEKLYKVNLY